MTDEPETFTITRHRKNGAQVIAHGSLPEVMAHVPDSRVVREKLKIINDSAVVEHKLKARADSLKAAEDSFKADVDSFRSEIMQDFMQDVMQDVMHKLDELACRMDAIEAERAKDPEDNELTVPPGFSDEGELQSPVEPLDPEHLDTPEPDLPRSPTVMEDN